MQEKLSPSARTMWLTDLMTTIQVMEGIMNEDFTEADPEYAALDEAVQIVNRFYRAALAE